MKLKKGFYYSQSFAYICVMSFLKKIIDFYIFSNLHVAIGTFCLVKITLQQYDLDENKTALFVLFSTIFVYNFIRFFRISEIKNWYLDWLRNHKSVLYVLSTISFLAMIYLGANFQLKAILWLLPFGLFTFFYVVPLPFKNISLRKVPGIKLFLIAVSYAGITVLFPLVQNDIEISTNEWMLFVQRFLFIVIITIPFDIRDLHCDSESLKTLPQKIGVKKSKLIGVFYAMLFFVLEFFKQPINDFHLIIGLVVIIISTLFLISSKENQSKYYSAFWVESLPIFWFLLIFIGLNL
jgi:hypothetical protein